MDNYYEYFVKKGNHPDKEDILKQETDYAFEHFNRYDAYLVAQLVIDKAYQEHRSIGVRIVLHGELIFQYMMDGLEVENSLQWLLRKERICHLTQHSSYYIFLDNMTSHQYDNYTHDQDYAVCGGGFPIFIKDEMIGCITVTGGRPQEDHQNIIDAFIEMKRGEENGR